MKDDEEIDGVALYLTLPPAEKREIDELTAQLERELAFQAGLQRAEVPVRNGDIKNWLKRLH